MTKPERDVKSGKCTYWRQEGNVSLSGLEKEDGKKSELSRNSGWLNLRKRALPISEGGRQGI